jgi:hypothetical protein
VHGEEDVDERDLLIWRALKEWLSQDASGQAILLRLAADPQAAARALADRLRGSSVPGGVATYVSGGQVGKLVAIARAERVYIGETPATPPALHQLPADLAASPTAWPSSPRCSPS